MERCPVCRAMLRQHQQCRRCNSDLSLAIAMERKAETFFRQAVSSLESADIIRAKEAIQSALWLHNTPLYQQFSGFIDSQPDGNEK